APWERPGGAHWQPPCCALRCERLGSGPAALIGNLRAAHCGASALGAARRRSLATSVLRTAVRAPWERPGSAHWQPPCCALRCERLGSGPAALIGNLRPAGCGASALGAARRRSWPFRRAGGGLLRLRELDVTHGPEAVARAFGVMPHAGRAHTLHAAHDKRLDELV